MDRVFRILIVDDEPLNRELLEACCELYGYESVTAESGTAALEALECDHRIDLVLLDANMGRVSGFDVAEQIRAHPKLWSLPIIMVTALSAREDRLRAVEAGANDF